MTDDFTRRRRQRRQGPPSDQDLQPVYDDIRQGMRQQLVREFPELETAEEREERETLDTLARAEEADQREQQEERRLAYEALDQPLPLPLSAHPKFLARVNNGYVWAVDKWHRQIVGFASSLEEFDGDTATFRVEATAGCRLSHAELIEKVAFTWPKYVVGLAPAKCYCVKIYTLQKGGVGGMVTPSDYPHEDDWAAAMADIFERIALAKEELKRPGYPYVEYRGGYDDPGEWVVIHHPDFRRGGS